MTIEEIKKLAENSMLQMEDIEFVDYYLFNGKGEVETIENLISLSIAFWSYLYYGSLIRIYYMILGITPIWEQIHDEYRNFRMYNR